MEKKNGMFFEEFKFEKIVFQRWSVRSKNADCDYMTVPISQSGKKSTSKVNKTG